MTTISNLKMLLRQCPRFIWFLFALALINGMVFVFTAPHPGVAGDALGYYWVSTQLHDALFVGGNPEVTVHFVRSPWYALTLGALSPLYFWKGDDTFFTGIYALQALFYALCVALVSAVTLELSQCRKAAIAAGIAALLYTSFLLYTDHLLREIQLTLFLLLFAWCWCRQHHRWAAAFLFFAITSNFLVVWVQLLVLAVVLLAGKTVLRLFCCTSETPILKRNQWILYLAVLIIPYLLLRWLFSFLETSPLDGGSLAMYAKTVGWSTIVPANSELPYRLIAQATQLPPFFSHFSESLTTTIKWFIQEPATFLQRYVVNVYRFFAHPSNVYHRTWLFFTPDFERFYHQCLLLLWLLGMPWLFQQRRWRVLYLFPIAWALTYACHHIEDRYNVAVMPFVIIGAVLTFRQLVITVSRPVFSGVILAVILVVAWLQGDLFPFAFALTSSCLPITYFMLGGVTAAALGMVYAVYVFRRENLSLRFSNGFTALLITVVMLIPVLVTLVMDPIVLGWHTRLMPGDSAERIFPLADTFFDRPDLNTFLVVDTEPAFDSDHSRLQISINGIAVTTRQVFPLGLEAQKYLTGDGFVPVGQFRQYRFYPVTEDVMNVMRKTHAADVRLSVPPASTPIRVYGDYPMTSSNWYRIPTPDWSYFSIYKVFYDDDGRLSSALIPVSSGTQNRWIHHGNALDADLSASPGLQSGQFRILFLRLKPHDGDDKGYPMAQYRLDEQGRIYRTLGFAY